MAAPHTATDLLAYNFNLEIFSFLHGQQGMDRPLVGQSFLHELAREGDVLTAEIILEKTGNPDCQDDEGRRPLHEAAAAGKLDMVRTLLAYGAIMDAPIAPFGHTALMLAVQRGEFAVTKYLIERGANLSVCEHLSGQSLLHIAAARGDIRMTGLLIASGCNVFAEDKRGQTARDHAAKHGHQDLSDILSKVMQHHARFCV